MQLVVLGVTASTVLALVISAPSDAIPIVKPGAPTIGTATAGPASATVTWSPSDVERRRHDHRVRDHSVRLGDRHATGDRHRRQRPERHRSRPHERHHVRIHRGGDQLGRHRSGIGQIQSGDPRGHRPRRADHRHGDARRYKRNGDLDRSGLQWWEFDHRLSDHPLHRHYGAGGRHRRRRPQLRRDRPHQWHHVYVHGCGNQRHQDRSGIWNVQCRDPCNRSRSTGDRHLHCW